MIVPFVITGAALTIFVLGFSLTSFREGETRAALVALSAAAGLAALWFAPGLVFPAFMTAMTAGAWCAVLLLVALLLFPCGKKAPLLVDDGAEASIDERDTMFARMNLEEGTQEHEAYYGVMHPELAGRDKKIRALPRLHEPGGRHYDAGEMAYSRVLFDIIEELRPLSEPGPARRPANGDAAQNTRRIKTLLRLMGASDSRITRLRPRHLYTHLGRRIEDWGRENTLDHAFVIVFAVEMDYRAVRDAPRAAALTESATSYMRGAAMALTLADLCASLGFQALAHFDANYRIVLPAAAHDAGLGDISVGNYHGVHPLVPRQILHSDTAHLPRTAQDNDLHSCASSMV